MNNIENNFGLPKISEDLDKEEFEYRNKYRNIYIRIILRCQNMASEELSGYNEKHHILPKCLGGGNEKENLVLMPVRYHIVAHMVLFMAFPDNSSLGFSVHCMLNGKNKLRSEAINKHISTRLISKIKEDYVASISGKNNPLYNIPRSEEVKQKLSIAAKNRSPEVRKRIADGRKNILVSEETRKKISISKTGFRFTEEMKTHLKEVARRGKDNHMSRKVVSPSGKVYDSIVDASTDMKIPYSTLTKWIVNNSHGWTYLDGDKTDFSNRSVEKTQKKIIGPSGKIYSSIIKASKEENIPYTTLRYWISGRVKDNHGWSYFNEELNKSQSD